MNGWEALVSIILLLCAADVLKAKLSAEAIPEPRDGHGEVYGE